MQLADDFLRSIDRPETALPAMINEKKATNIAQNRAVLKSIARAILFCARQCIALRGHDENSKKSGNHGNFLSLLKLISEHDEVLKNHLEAPSNRSVTYSVHVPSNAE